MRAALAGPLANRWLATAVWGLIALVWLTAGDEASAKAGKQQKQQREEEKKDPLTVELHRQQQYRITGCCACAAIG